MLLFILVFTIVQSILAVARGSQCCFPFAFFSALPSGLLSPPSLFQFPARRLVAGFIATMFFTHGFFLTERPFFNLPVKKNIYLYCFSELKTLPSFLFYCYSFGMIQIT